MSRPTLVLLHGVGLDHSVWDTVAALLADRFEVIAPDLPGHGKRPPAPPGVTLADLADGMASAIPAGSHLVGFSLGALVAQHLAIHRPELVASLTSVASVCRRTPEERAQVLTRLDTAATDIRASSVASLRRWYDGTSVALDQVARTEAMLLAIDPDSFLNCYRVFATADAEIAPLLERITVPALAVTGSDDPGSTPEMSRRLATAIPHCRMHIIPGARHMLPVQCPRELADTITAFLGTVIGGDIHV
ncbi:alpha/beta hydrolase [Mycolicibacterium smegmatis]|uniref:alpha/beta fold hydrolase n=1 Tax=Mycolicibacterium smegmatis TaxID=1772 RepID=UPI0005D911D6|nr:alpha/beta hydrolase [Mycolicibacterium smegmatis]MDF1898071.1 alpha/beta hydrolase [Mycolicibacterium smegmatis]MDF1904902.1 alpha/beta hydrolase [Mycolicibacterium smegmatis]MDF1916830.1 alpha/beta hydrolase [Mycolicibacterium smegmatis]MDF1923236.1 alpha/beta hydrolase [Mycolicibacterium smegmatis]UAK52794.1 alpha/beta hydrolase [Mycolicibacterium smegmatis]